MRTEGWQRVFTNRQQKSGWQRQRHLPLRLYPFDSLASLPRLFAGREQRPLGSPGLQKPLGTGGREGGRRPGRHVALPRPVIAQDTEQMWSWFLRGGRTFHTNNTQGLRRSLHSIMTAALREQVLLFIYLVIYLLIYILTVVVVFVLLGVQVHIDTSESKVVIHVPYRSIIG